MKVIVTRPRGQAQPLVGRIEELGFEVVECPLIEIIRTSDEPIDCAVRQQNPRVRHSIERYLWLGEKNAHHAADCSAVRKPWNRLRLPSRFEATALIPAAFAALRTS